MPWRVTMAWGITPDEIGPQHFNVLAMRIGGLPALTARRIRRNKIVGMIMDKV